MIFYSPFKSAIGVLHLLASPTHLVGLYFDSSWKKMSPEAELVEKETPLLKKTKKELKEYFDKKRTEFTIPLSFEGTEFQQKAWRALLTIPYGQTVSYSEQAQRIQNPKAIRCVGSTNGKNPIAIIAPCHRVIGKNGSLTGFGGGLPLKKFLLDLESSQLSFQKAQK